MGCQTEVSVKDNKIIQIDGRNGPANENRLCVKGRFGFDYINHEGRITKPLIRKKDAPKQWDVQIDDKNIYDYFEETSWENALEVSANGLTKTLKEKGPKGLAGFGSAKCSNEEAYLFQKLVRHEDKGSRMVKPIFARLKLPLGAPMAKVRKLVQLHLRPIALTKENITDSWALVSYKVVGRFCQFRKDAGSSRVG